METRQETGFSRILQLSSGSIPDARGTTNSSRAVGRKGATEKCFCRTCPRRLDSGSPSPLSRSLDRENRRPAEARFILVASSSSPPRSRSPVPTVVTLRGEYIPLANDRTKKGKETGQRSKNWILAADKRLSIRSDRRSARDVLHWTHRTPRPVVDRSRSRHATRGSPLGYRP